MITTQYADFAFFKRTKLNYSKEDILKIFKIYSKTSFKTPELKIDNYFENTFWSLFDYFLLKSSFSGDLMKGVYLWGGLGTGKSTLMYFFSWFLYHYNGNSFQVNTSSDIVNLYLNPYYMATNSAFFNKKIICIDDIGVESSVIKNYGNDLFPLADFLENRYSVYQKCRYLTHVTTNLSPKQFGIKYGERLESRFYDMFNIFELKGPDRRKLNNQTKKFL
jgi:DNA replication protein DnaC